MIPLVYPSALPGPIAAPFQAAERRLLSSLPGPRQARPLQRDRLAMQQVDFIFTHDELTSFMAWLDMTLVRAGAWFTSNWAQPQGGEGVRRFIGEPTFPTYYPNVGWHVSASCEVRGRGMAPGIGWRILRTDSFAYKVVALADTTDYSAQDLDDSDWLESHGTFGDAPHPASDGWPDPNTIIPTDDSVWLRKRSVLPALVPVTITFKADNTPHLWVNGAVTSFANVSTWVYTATYLPTEFDIVIALRVDDTGPPGPSNRIYAGLEATI
jgi:hypothetical protein